VTPAVAPLPASMRVLERGWVSSNNIVFFDGDEAAVVDTGYGDHSAQTVSLLAHALEGRALTRIVNTHSHSDHIGGNAALRRAHAGVSIAIPAGEAGIIRAWDEEALHLAPMGQTCERFDFDATYDDGDRLVLGGLAWRAVASPGHDMASQMLWCESERILISADALWEQGFGILFSALPPEVDPAPTFAAQRATLDAIAALKPCVVIPGHGSPFTDIESALRRARGRLDYFEADPERNARNAAKVILSFLLMIEGRIALEELGARLERMPMLVHINRAVLRLDRPALVDWLVVELEKSRAAHRSGGWLLAGPAA